MLISTPLGAPFLKIFKNLGTQTQELACFFLCVAVLFYVHGKYRRSCRDGQLT